MPSYNVTNTNTKSSHRIVYAHPEFTDHAIAAWFLGPKVENHDVLEDQLRKIVKYLKHGRATYFPDDSNFITQDMIQSNTYRKAVDKLDQVVEYLSILLANHSVPFSSPRYAAHVAGDTTLPAVVGYALGMLYNQNNVTPEASPLTSVIEYVVGQDFCRMLGFHTADERRGRPDDPLTIGWGHVTCDGSVANYESMWVARSLKFYPLSLQLAIIEGDLGFVKDTFMVTTTSRVEKRYKDCSAWELLNLKQDVILGLGDKLTKQFSVSSDYLEGAMRPYLAQIMGKDKIEKRFGIKSPQYFCSITKHYSFNKGANILGIGESNLVDVDIDMHARMDADDLKQKLLDAIQAEIPIYAVVAIMGTTEHGAVDPLDKILRIRSELEKSHGVSFLVHCDAAWGGYFASILRDLPSDWTGPAVDSAFLKKPLLRYTKVQLDAMRHADSVTIDSHKSGYCPYPAGGLCYRDERMRFLITTTSPYINTTGEGVEAMGTYGLEGSKPGASPLAVWVSNMVLGLHMGGYGTLLSQSIFSGVRYYTLWCNVAKTSKLLYVVPFNVLPIEKDKARKTIGEIEGEKERLADSILRRSFADVIKDKNALDDIESIGSDLMINTFSCNFKLENGELNKDVTEANFLNQRIYDRLSIRRITDDINQVPVLLVGTVWEQKLYKSCLTQFKSRLGLDSADPTDLHAYSSVAMSPFVMDNLIQVVGDAFLKVAEEEAQRCRERIAIKPAYHGFVMQGTDTLYLAYLPMLNVGRHRQQLVVTAKLPQDAMEVYIKARADNPRETFTLHTSKMMLLQDILDTRSCEANLIAGLPQVLGTTFGNLVTKIKLTDITVVKHHSLAPKMLSSDYPTAMMFYLYGTRKQQHIEHIVIKAPNAQLASSQVTVELDQMPSDVQLAAGVIAVMDERYEAAMQPFSDSHKPGFFRTGVASRVSVYTDPYKYNTDSNIAIRDIWKKIRESKPIAKGTLTIGKEAFVDAAHINQETLAQVEFVPHNRAASPKLHGHHINGLLDNFRAVLKGPEVVSAYDIEDAVSRRSATLGDYYLASAEHTPGAPSISRYAMQLPTDALTARVSLRKDWHAALTSIQGSPLGSSHT